MYRIYVLILSFLIVLAALNPANAVIELSPQHPVVIPEGELAGLRIFMPATTVTSGSYGITDVGIIPTGGNDIVDTLVPPTEIDLVLGVDGDACDSPTPCVIVDSFDDLAVGEYGQDFAKNTYAFWNDSDFSSIEYISSQNYSQGATPAGSAANWFLKFNANIELDRVFLMDEHPDYQTGGWLIGDVEFYDTTGAELTPIIRPFGEGDYGSAYNGGSYSNSHAYEYIFSGTKHPAPTVSGVFFFASSSDQVSVDDVGIFVDGDHYNDIMEDMLSLAQANGAQGIEGIQYVSAGYYGTGSGQDENDKDWNDSEFSVWPYADTVPATGSHRTVNAGDGAYGYFKFSSARELNSTVIQFNSSLFADPKADVTWYDEGGNELLATSTCKSDQDMQVVGTASDSASRNACFWRFDSVLKTETKPIRLALPQISSNGTNAEGDTLTTTNGTWDNSPTGYTYRWLRDGVAIGGETSSTYTIAAADDGTYLQSEVTATNANGSVVVKSAYFEAFTSPPPSNPTSIDGIKINIDPVTWVGVYEIYIIENDDTELLSGAGLTRVNGANANTYATLTSDNSFTSDSDYGSATQVGRIQDLNLTNIHWNDGSGVDLNVFVRWAHASSTYNIKYIDLCLSNVGTYGVPVVTVTDRNDNAFTPTNIPSGTGDNEGTCGSGTLYRWEFI